MVKLVQCIAGFSELFFYDIHRQPSRQKTLSFGE